MSERVNNQSSKSVSPDRFNGLVRDMFQLEFNPSSLSREQEHNARKSRQELAELRHSNLLTGKQQQALDILGQMVSYDVDIGSSDFNLKELLDNSR